MEAQLIGNVVHYSKVVTRSLTLTPLEMHTIRLLEHEQAQQALSISRRGQISDEDIRSIVELVKGPKRSIPKLAVNVSPARKKS